MLTKPSWLVYRSITHALHCHLYDCQAELGRLAGEMDGLRRREEEDAAERARVTGQLEGMSQRASAAEEKLAVVEAALETACAAREVAEAALAAARQAAEDTSGRLAESAAECARLRRELGGSQETVIRLRLQRELLTSALERGRLPRGDRLRTMARELQTGWFVGQSPSDLLGLFCQRLVAMAGDGRGPAVSATR